MKGVLQEIADEISYRGTSETGLRRVVEVIARLPDDVRDAVIDAGPVFLDALACTVDVLHYYLTEDEKSAGVVITNLVILNNDAVGDGEPEDVALGAIAHELGHLFQNLEWDAGTKTPGDLNIEKDADARALSWGFVEEIRALHDRMRESGLFEVQYGDPEYGV